MRQTSRPWAAAALAAAALSAAAAPAPLHAQAIDTLALRAHTRFLADDLLEGRGTGTRGERLAAAYIASQLTELGLRPMGSQGYLAPYPLAAARVMPTTAATLLWEDHPAAQPASGSAAFQHGEDFILNTGGAGAFRGFGGPLLWLGSPEDALRADLPAAELAGRVVVLDATPGAAATQLVPRWVSAGVAGVVVLIHEAERFDLYVRSRGPERYYVDAAVDDPVWQPDLPVLLAGPTMSGMVTDFLGFLAIAARGLDVPVPLPGEGVRLEVDIEVVTRPVPSANVAAYVPGTDSALRDEVVLYTAHYDHLGISTPVGGDSIYNGFSDNAAGVAMLLTIAEAMAADPPARSVGFAFFSGEERGLLGATYFAGQALPDGLRTVAVVNLDAGAPPAAPLQWRIAGGDASTLGDLAAEVTAAAGWEPVLGAASPNSDYWPFLARGVPAVFLIPGPVWEGVDEVGRQALMARWDRYHQAADHWHEDFPFVGLARYAHLALRVGRAAAEAAAPPTMHDAPPPLH